MILQTSLNHIRTFKKEDFFFNNEVIYIWVYSIFGFSGTLCEVHAVNINPGGLVSKYRTRDLQNHHFQSRPAFAIIFHGEIMGVLERDEASLETIGLMITGEIVNQVNTTNYLYNAEKHVD